jgi:tellurium resistance protein TerD
VSDDAMPLDKGEVMPAKKRFPISSGRRIRELVVHLGWDVRRTAGPPFDLDAVAFPLTASGTVPSGRHCVYYNNLTDPDRSIEHEGDDLDGGGGGEIIRVHLRHVSPTIERIVFAVVIYEAKERHEHFGNIERAYIKFTAEDFGVLDEHRLTGDFASYTGVVIGEMMRQDDDWSFQAIEKGYVGGLAEIGRQYGVSFKNVAPS